MAKNPNIDDSTRSRALKFASDNASPAKRPAKAAPANKPRIVGKKELEDSGLSLRDFLNKERGLTRRKSADPTAGEAKDKAAQTAADAIDPGADDSGESNVRRQNAEIRSRTGLSPREYVSSGKAEIDRQDDKAAKIRNTVSRVTPENKDELSDMTFKKGGKVKKMAAGGSVSSASKRGDGCAQRGKTRA
jgi:hypothetical protein